MAAAAALYSAMAMRPSSATFCNRSNFASERSRCSAVLLDKNITPWTNEGAAWKPPRKVTEDAWFVGKIIRTRLPLCEQSLA
jgi:hypothetical protein